MYIYVSLIVADTRISNGVLFLILYALFLLEIKTQNLAAIDSFAVWLRLHPPCVHYEWRGNEGGTKDSRVNGLLSPAATGVFSLS